MGSKFNKTVLSNIILIIFTSENFRNSHKFLAEDKWVLFQLSKTP